MVPSLTFSQACEGLIYYKTAIGLSPHTLTDYRVSFAKLAKFLEGDPPFASLTRAQLVAFFAWLQDTYLAEPDGAAPRGKLRLSPKSILNIHTNLSALWSWAVTEGYAPENLLRTIRRPSANPPVIEPFSQEEISRLLAACRESLSWKNRPDVTHTRPMADRDRAILLILLDTGLRSAELCGIRLEDIDRGRSRIRLRGKGRGREGKERVVFFGRRTAQALWRVLQLRAGSMGREDFVFTVGAPENNKPLAPDRLRTLLHRLGERAGVQGVHPHRFRHTFAITFLRNGGNLFALQELLGHTTLDMVRRYVRIAEVDVEAAHKSASPVDNWHL